MVACIAWRFWLGALSNKAYKSRQGQRNPEEIGALLVRPARQKHTKPPCYAGYIYGGLQLYGYKQVAVSLCGYVVGKIHS